MQDKYTRISFERIFNVEKIITLFYMEFSKNFSHSGETHDFWEMIYIDKGEMLCTQDRHSFVLKSGELTFHRPGEFHSLTGNKKTAPNVSVITFETKSREMKYFEGKIFRLDTEERALLSMLMSEGRSCYRLSDPKAPLSQSLEKIEDAPMGSSQMTKNLLEIFLIKLRRDKEMLTKKMRRGSKVSGIEIPYEVKPIIDCLESRIYGSCSISDVAKSIGKSESAVKNLFSSYKSGGIMKHYNLMKIEEAKRLIREGEYNMTQIADMLCYDNPQYFSKCFKMHTNMSPSEYKISIIE